MTTTWQCINLPIAQWLGFRQPSMCFSSLHPAQCDHQGKQRSLQHYTHQWIASLYEHKHSLGGSHTGVQLQSVPQLQRKDKWNKWKFLSDFKAWRISKRKKRTLTVSNLRPTLLRRVSPCTLSILNTNLHLSLPYVQPCNVPVIHCTEYEPQGMGPKCSQHCSLPWPCTYIRWQRWRIAINSLHGWNSTQECTYVSRSQVQAQS